MRPSYHVRQVGWPSYHVRQVGWPSYHMRHQLRYDVVFTPVVLLRQLVGQVLLLAGFIDTCNCMFKGCLSC